jgi:hypothetical protein
MSSNDEYWVDAAAGPVVRPYALTRGRTSYNGELFDMMATVVTRMTGSPDLSRLGPEHVLVLELARSPVTVIDIASDINLPLAVVRILLADLRELRLITIRAPAMNSTGGSVNKDILRAVLDGLRRL